jgi:hypothetical protein
MYIFWFFCPAHGPSKFCFWNCKVVRDFILKRQNVSCWSGITSPLSIIEDSRMTVLHSNTIDNYFIYIHFFVLGTKICILCKLVCFLIIRDYALFSALTWFVIYIYYWNLQFLKNVIIIKAKIYRDNVARQTMSVLKTTHNL